VWPIPNSWDVVALILVCALVFLLGLGASEMAGHFHVGQPMPISLDPIYLPYYALRTVLRMIIAMGFSLLFTFVFGTWAAKSPQAERLIIPMIDILQSVPVLGFLSISAPLFIMLMQGSMLGPEAAAIFAIFTSQVWNMALSFYQGVRTVPDELREAGRMFHLSSWQRFWRIDVPFATPGLLWNAMMSMSGSWVFLVAAEVIAVAHQFVPLPGIGSYIWQAINQKDMAAIGYVVITMLLVIALYDQLIFRPLVAWAEKFKAEDTSAETVPESWVLNLFQRTRVVRVFGTVISAFGDRIVNARWLQRRRSRQLYSPNVYFRTSAIVAWNLLLAGAVIASLVFVARYIFAYVSLYEAQHVIYLGFVTGVRVMVMIIVSSIIWVPIGVSVGMSPRASQIVQPIAQFLAAFPANLLFPFVVWFILHYQLNVNIWVSPLMILGTQWYILFNVVAGTMAIPKNLHQAVGVLNVRGWLRWRRFILPAIFPYYITGAITAAGGAWNISIIAEAVSWGNTKLQATGLGAYITQMSDLNDYPRLALGIVVMSLYVLVINRVVWRPLYNLAEERYQVR